MYNFSKAIELIFRYKLFKEVTHKVVLVDNAGLTLATFKNMSFKSDDTGDYYYYKSINSGQVLESKAIINILNTYDIKRIDCIGEHSLEYKITLR